MNSTSASTLKRDPVCGMMVDPATAKARVEHAGETYFFCHSSCGQKFQANPEQYLKPTAGSGLVTLGVVKPQPTPNASQPVAAKTAYVCPMCPEVREEKP